MTDARRSIPAVHTLLADDAVAPILSRAPRSVVTDAIRAVIEEVRAGAQAPESSDAWAIAIETAVERIARPSLRRVINATGVILHTNLGRAPLARVARDAIVAIAEGATNIEYDLVQGTRGSRLTHARQILCELTGGEDAIVVNNCASAMLLALRALAHGRDVIVSRGELIEIGGSFRIPDIMAQADVRLVEVGTTNRTHLDDYRRALGAPTGAIVKVHRSNFTMDGFVAAVSAQELMPLAAESNVPLIHDLGSGLMIDLARWGFTGEPTAAHAVAVGADVVVMSGDKLLGGPQAGIAIGRKTAIARMRAHPLARALRVDKLTLAALEATLALYRTPKRAVKEIPALAMMTATPEDVRARASALQSQFGNAGIHTTIVPTVATTGGGAFPTAQIPSYALALNGDAMRWDAALRATPTPVIGHIVDDKMLLEIRTVLPDDEPAFVESVQAAAQTTSDARHSV